MSILVVMYITFELINLLIPLDFEFNFYFSPAFDFLPFKILGLIKC